MPINDDIRRDFPHSDEGGGNWPPQIGPHLAGATAGPPISTRSNEAAQQMPPHYAPRSSSPVQRVNVNFSEQAYQTLQDLAARSGKSMSEVLREAIALKAWFDQERAQGNRILVERPNGQVRELISV